jgi:adenylate kinase family enzyme
VKKVAVFGNAGGGKSTVARRLAEITGLPLIVLDILQFTNGYRSHRDDGGKISDDQYLKLHSEILSRAAWIIDGYGSVASAWERFAVADTLVYVDLPLTMHYWGVTKRLVKGLFKTPPGWPENSPLLQSSIDSYRVVWRCHAELTPRYRQLIAESSSKRVYHLRSYSEINCFLETLERDYRRGAPAEGGASTVQKSCRPCGNSKS